MRSAVSAERERLEADGDARALRSAAREAAQAEARRFFVRILAFSTP